MDGVKKETNWIKLSEINFVPIRPKNGLLGFVSFVLNNSFHIGDIAIYSRLNREGYRLVYRNRRLSNGAEVNVFFPISRNAANSIEEQVFLEYKNF